MVLNITWSDADIDSVKHVLLSENHNITQQTKTITQTFIDIVKAGGDLRTAFNTAMVTLLSLPDQLIYFIRQATLDRIMIRYEQVPEFIHVVSFYSSIVKAARYRT